MDLAKKVSIGSLDMLQRLRVCTIAENCYRTGEISDSDQSYLNHLGGEAWELFNSQKQSMQTAKRYPKATLPTHGSGRGYSSRKAIWA